MKIDYFASADIKPLTEHSSSLGWYSEQDWECFLRTGAVFGHRLQSSEIVSSAYLSNFENKVGWLGAVIVNSRFQGKKLGRDLIQKALSILPEESDFALALIATERGKRMYEQAGFVEIGNSHKFIANIENENNERELTIRNYNESDFEIIDQLDCSALGYKRSKLLRERVKSAVKILVSETPSNEIDGFVILSKDGARISIGPIVATDSHTAEKLLKSAIATKGSYRLDVPHWQNELMNSLVNLGFELERICPLLTYEGRPLPRASDNYFALMAQALG